MFASKKADCPFWRGPCRKEECRLWIRVQGKNPQSEEYVERFGCAFEWMPMLILDVAQQSRQAGASTDKVATEVAKVNEAVRAKQVIRIDHHLPPPDVPPLRLIEGK